MLITLILKYKDYLNEFQKVEMAQMIIFSHKLIHEKIIKLENKENKA